MNKTKGLRNRVLIGLAVMVLGLLIVLASNIISKNEIKNKLNMIPELELFDVYKQKSFLLSDLVYENHIVLVYINTECAICQDQVQELEQISDRLEGNLIVLVSTQSTEKLEDYFSEIDFISLNTIVIAEDKKDILFVEYDIKSTPYFLIYNSVSELVLKQKGFIKAEKLKQILKL